MSKKLNIEEFINRANKIHNSVYDYSLVEYLGYHSKIKIICKEHGIFEQLVYNHLSGKTKCPKCVGGVKHTLKEFLIKSKNCHGEKYDYSLVEYKNARTKVKIICKTHGVFEQAPQHHTNGVGCPSCNESKGERQIVKILNNMKIEFKREKRFEDCRFKNPLPFDFYLPILNTCIEYDGMHHFRKWDRFGGQKSLDKQTIKDQIKNEYCKNNTIKLIRIRYDDNINQERFEILLK